MMSVKARAAALSLKSTPIIPIQNTYHPLRKPQPIVSYFDSQPLKSTQPSNISCQSQSTQSQSQSTQSQSSRLSHPSQSTKAPKRVEESESKPTSTTAIAQVSVKHKLKRKVKHRRTAVRPKRMTIKAVFFDLYGVYVRYLNNEVALGLIRKIITTPDLREKIFAYERGQYSCEECLDVVSIVHPPLKDPEFCKDLENVDFWSIVEGVDKNIEIAIKKLKENGYKVGILCNNAYWTSKKTKSMIPDDMSMFDAVIESCRLGYRKSDPEIYWLAADAFGLECHECVLVDDSMLNVYGALDQGMFGIKQHGEDSKKSIQELENLLYVRLH